MRDHILANSSHIVSPNFFFPHWLVKQLKVFPQNYPEEEVMVIKTTTLCIPEYY